ARLARGERVAPPVAVAAADPHLHAPVRPRALAQRLEERGVREVHRTEARDQPDRRVHEGENGRARGSFHGPWRSRRATVNSLPPRDPWPWTKGRTDASASPAEGAETGNHQG